MNIFENIDDEIRNKYEVISKLTDILYNLGFITYDWALHHELVDYWRNLDE